MALGQFFSQRFGYAAHALAYLARKPFGELTTLPELAAWMKSFWPGASETYLSNVIQRLARGGVLQSHRGIAGGYSLGKPADELTLRDVAEVLEGVSLQRCALSLGPSCPKVGRCSIQRTLRGVEEQYLESLQKITLASILSEIADKLPQDVSV
ncbi:MAG: Rrf2 family transcriptional regulator [Gemmataceae bacterium]|nr:Rrf2 family transcriptional regulator [Gemmataceae bacterium]